MSITEERENLAERLLAAMNAEQMSPEEQMIFVTSYIEMNLLRSIIKRAESWNEVESKQ